MFIGGGQVGAFRALWIWKAAAYVCGEAVSAEHAVSSGPRLNLSSGPAKAQELSEEIEHACNFRAL